MPLTLPPKLMSVIFSALVVACAGHSGESTFPLPTQGRVTEMVNGDLMCYVTLVDQENVSYQLGATFEICEETAQFIDQAVQVSYETIAVHDCESAEPCGKTRQAQLITKMERVP